MSDMKCPICGEMLQKYGEVDPDTGTCTVLGANCPDFFHEFTGKYPKILSFNAEVVKDEKNKD